MITTRMLRLVDDEAVALMQFIRNPHIASSEPYVRSVVDNFISEVGDSTPAEFKLHTLDKSGGESS
jgi:hypothetical protein